jgi:N-acetylmuramoyl-L-alanine amidase
VWVSTGEVPGALSAAFAGAAREFSVPEAVLLALSYEESRWEAHGGYPSVAGGFGPMHLTDRAGLSLARGVPRPTDPADTLPAAAALLGISTDRLRQDPAQNLRGGAALLARYEREITGAVPVDPGRWYAAVARYSGSPDLTGARAFADDVYSILRHGITATTGAGERLRLAADPTVRSERAGLAGLGLLPGSRRSGIGAECPVVSACDYVPAGYAQMDPKDKTKYGNYALAARPGDGDAVRYIVIHDTETPYARTLDLFADPTFHASAHYVIRAVDGHVTQMVPTRHVAWHAANSYINAHAIGIEHEGFAVQGGTWFTESMYRSSARLVRYLAGRYRIPLNRAHVLGHDNVPAPTPRAVHRMHWDPGPFWDWDHYLELLRGTPPGPARPDSPIVTIAPRFATNLPPLTDCDSTGCRSLPPQPTSFVPLHTQPADDAPLLGDPALAPGPGTTRIDDLRDKASSGQRFVVAERRPPWTAIWFGGQEAWFRDPGRSVGAPAHGRLARPRPGLTSIPVFGRPSPEPQAYPPGVPSQPLLRLPYTIPAGQAYVADAAVQADVYLARSVDGSLPADRTVVRGHARYYPIEYHHRLGFVRSADVTIEVT